jgi:hypothetical protein
MNEEPAIGQKFDCATYGPAPPAAVLIVGTLGPFDSSLVSLKL